jgi:hypothetical protein
MCIAKIQVLAVPSAHWPRKSLAATSGLVRLHLDQVKADLELIVRLPGRDKRAIRFRAILTFSALVGAMSLARAVSDEALSREILNAVADLLKHPA